MYVSKFFEDVSRVTTTKWTLANDPINYISVYKWSRASGYFVRVISLSSLLERGKRRRGREGGWLNPGRLGEIDSVPGTRSATSPASPLFLLHQPPPPLLPARPYSILSTDNFFLSLFAVVNVDAASRRIPNFCGIRF